MPTRPAVIAALHSRCLHLALAGLALWQLGGCTTTPTDRQYDLLQQSVSQEAWARQRAAELAQPQLYRVQVGDVMDLRFRRAAELNETLTVRPDGLVTLLWVGEVQAAGLTPRELTQQIERSYISVLREPRLDLLMRTMQPSRVFMGGEVARPGELRLTGSTSLAQAIVQAGDFTPDAQRDSVIVVRQRGSEEPDYIRVDFGSAVVSRLSDAREGPCDERNPLACADARPMKPEAFLLEPLDLVIVPKTQVAGVAQFFERYVNQILPIWRNFGISATYELRRSTIVVPDNR